METTELQKSIVQRVLKTDDKHLLNRLQLFLNNNYSQEAFPFSKNEKISISDLKNDQVSDENLPNEVLFYQNTKWMSE
ncbi:MAG TPA: hypothetical protein DCL77_05505 [Prolixibacteraceae bacterium]|jgi:hypothetical protein|nr:hypothetical protein [Prolixibacteraceae bacterium]